MMSMVQSERTQSAKFREELMEMILASVRVAHCLETYRVCSTNLNDGEESGWLREVSFEFIVRAL